DTDKEVTDTELLDIQNIVKTIKGDAKVGERYMTLGTTLYYEKKMSYDEGKDAGMDMGIRIGEKRGIQIGEERGIQIGEEQAKETMAKKLLELGVEPIKIQQAMKAKDN
ncbi:MAG: hypothetical protein IJC76_10530, partial [Lachnospiraceae bacterium]|nr:hypothetical protein [Lachnospiraceae bacterium]